MMPILWTVEHLRIISGEFEWNIFKKWYRKVNIFNRWSRKGHFSKNGITNWIFFLMVSQLKNFFVRYHLLKIGFSLFLLVSLIDKIVPSTVTPIEIFTFRYHFVKMFPIWIHCVVLIHVCIFIVMWRARCAIVAEMKCLMPDAFIYI